LPPVGGGFPPAVEGEQIDGSVGLDVDVLQKGKGGQFLKQGEGLVPIEEGFPSRQADVAVAPALHLFQNLSHGEHFFRGMRGVAVGGVAPGAAQIAVIQPDEGGGKTRFSPFPFHRLKDFHQGQSDFLGIHRRSSIHSRRRIAALVGVSSSRRASSRRACSGEPSSFSPSSNFAQIQTIMFSTLVFMGGRTPFRYWWSRGSRIFSFTIAFRSLKSTTSPISLTKPLTWTVRRYVCPWSALHLPSYKCRWWDESKVKVFSTATRRW